MINLTRGFRRLGWVITLPVAVPLVVMSIDWTKEFLPNAYEVAAETDPNVPSHEQNITEVKGLGYAYFPKEIPTKVTDAVIADFSNARNKADRVRVELILAPFNLREEIKTQVIDGFQKAANTDELKEKLDQIVIPNGAKHDLWNLKAARPKPDESLYTVRTPSGEEELQVGPRDVSPTDILENSKKFRVVNPNAYTLWQFTVASKINKVRLIALIAGSVTLVALVIQGLISVVAWVGRGFKTV
jgi:hypothetical protein